MRELLSIVLATILPILYMGSRKHVYFVNYRKYTGSAALCLAIVGLSLLMMDSERRLAYVAFAPLAHFLVILAVEESFKKKYGRYAAPVYSHPNPPEGQFADKMAMLAAVLICLAITAAVLYSGRRVGD